VAKVGFLAGFHAVENQKLSKNSSVLIVILSKKNSFFVFLKKTKKLSYPKNTAIKMTTQELTEQIFLKKSFLCIGLDVDLDKIPKHLLVLDDPIFEFNKAIIEATHDLCVAYKPNVAFYETYGVEGWRSLEKTINYINRKHPEVFTIADAKRGDIGNTSAKYAKTFFDVLCFDSVTVNPYMGKDSIEPFLDFKNKYTILLALTSNSGATDFQLFGSDKKMLFESVLETSKSWKNSENLMYVVGATQTNYLKKIREIVPNNFLLIPGVGTQGGSLKEVYQFGRNKNVGLLVNSSRKIIYASNQDDFAQKTRQQAYIVQKEMQNLL